MPRALKTFITNLGFFELAIAAPSMKAALEAWGMSHNAFQQGFAKQTDDPDIIAATNELPGIVLKRPVGSSGAFKEQAELPLTLPNLKPPKVEGRAAPKPVPRKGPRPKLDKNKKLDKTKKADIISFEKARAQRAKQRAKDEAKQEAKLARERETRRNAVEKAQAAFDEAREMHEQQLDAIRRERDKIDRREEQEKERWASQRKRLEDAIWKAKR